MNEQNETKSIVNEITAEKLTELYHEQGLTLAQTAKAVGVSVPTVRVRMAEFGIDVRSRGGAGGRKKIVISKEKLTELYHEQGLTLQEVADKCGVSLPTVRARMEEHGVDVRSPGRSTGSKLVELDEQQLTELYHEQGLTLAETAEALNVSPGTVRNRMLEFGIDTRPPGRQAASDQPPATPEPEFTQDDVPYNKLRQIAKELGIDTTGKKAEIFERVVAAKAQLRA
jgi:transcriptional regulator with XRE-family HTH domain